jgi:hypothetical protein
MTCFIQFVRLSFPYLIWRRANQYTIFRLRVHSECDFSAEDAYSSMSLDPTLAFVGGQCCPTFDFAIAFSIMITFYTLLTSLFCIRMYGLMIKSLWRPRICEMMTLNEMHYNPAISNYLLVARLVWKVLKRKTSSCISMYQWGECQSIKC